MRRDIPLILERLGSSPGQWQEYLQALTERERLYGVAFAVHAESLERYSQSRGVGKLSNLNGCRRTASV